MISEKKRISNKKWDDANIFKKGVALPLEYKPQVEKKMADEGISFNRYIRNLVEKDLGIKGGK